MFCNFCLRMGSYKIEKSYYEFIERTEFFNSNWHRISEMALQNVSVDVINLNIAEVGGMIGDIVTVTVDRPLGSYHPVHKNIYYPINYGYVEEIIAPDGEAQDVYILGVNEAVQKFTGKIIAIIHRLNDVEDKWVVCPENMTFTREEIMEKVQFQEQYFRSELIM